MQNIVIDPEFKALIPQLAADEYELLEASIQAEGCRDALVVWGDILVDGHNRYAICQKHGVGFQTVARAFDSREDVIIWMVNNQLARRNITSFVRGELALRMKAAIANKAKANLVTSTGGANPQPLLNLAKPEIANTRAEIAKAADLSQETVRKVEKVTANAPKSVTTAARSGDLSVDRAYKITMALQNLPDEFHEPAIKLAGDNDEKVNILARLHKSQGSPETNGTFDELMSTGGFHWGDDLEKWCNFLTAPIEDIQRGLKSIAVYHAKLESDKRRDHRVGEAVNLAQLSKTYNIVYADPPWRYEHVKTENRAIENHYPTMELDEICKLPITEVAAPDAVLFIWATSPKLAEAIQVLTAWGFVYRTCMVWKKDKIGMGYYVRQQHELLLIATRGTLPVPMPSDRYSSVIDAPRGKHSEKPERFYEVIEAMYPEYDKVELFSRNVRKGWDGWGNQYAAAA